MPAHWFDDDRFWDAVAPFLFTAERCGDATSDEVDAIVKMLGVQPAARILDLCCGVGRHSLELAARGFSTTAVDRTAAYLERARRSAAGKNVAVEFVQA